MPMLGISVYATPAAVEAPAHLLHVMRVRDRVQLDGRASVGFEDAARAHDDAGKRNDERQ
jgi:hypothetical protein